MYENYKQIFSKLVDTDAILSEAMAISGDRPSSELVMALTVKAIADKMQLQVDQLKEQIFINKGKSLQELEDEGKLNTTNVVSLTDARNTKQANENLQHVVSAWGDLSPEAAADQEAAKVEFDNERKHAAALNKEITLGDEWDSKDIYLTTLYGPGKVKMIIGLHAIGHAGQHQYNLIGLDKSVTVISTDFMVMEAWGNEYDEEHNMLGRGSFRLNTNDIDSVAKEYEAEGWTRCDRPDKLPTNT